ncbi:ORF6N domain-containing protein [Acidovorax sp. LjRoot38]|uniref:ORF6N domain-containing protein n=1 Tax=Acidovorax sp. LjRoot38 TaxID=3342327 RepID=UPI003ECC2D03
MSNIVKINDIDMQVIERHDQRFATLAQIDAVHGRPGGTARKRFNDNRERFIEGEDFIKLSASEIRTRFPGVVGERATEEVTLMTEQGYLMLVKSFTDDLAWQVQRQLVNGYFRAKQALPAVKDPQIAAVILALTRVDAVEQEQKRQADELARIAENMAVIEARTQPENKHFTVMGYANLIGQSVDVRTAASLGKRCASLSRERGLVIGDVSDPRFGTVHSYHESVLQEVLPSAVKEPA